MAVHDSRTMMLHTAVVWTAVKFSTNIKAEIHLDLLVCVGHDFVVSASVVLTFLCECLKLPELGLVVQRLVALFIADVCYLCHGQQSLFLWGF